MFDVLDRLLACPDNKPSPEASLLVAVLIQAATDIRPQFIRNGRHGRFSAQARSYTSYCNSLDAYNFLHSNVFRVYCGLIGAEHSAVRKAILTSINDHHTRGAVDRLRVIERYSVRGVPRTTYNRHLQKQAVRRNNDRKKRVVR